VRVSLSPGYYRFGMEVIERNSGRSASYRRSVMLPDLEGRPAISDIQFAGRIRETEAGGRFIKGTLEVVPHATRVYRKPRPVIFYCEVYGLDTNPEGISYYDVGYTVSPLGKRRWGPVLLESDLKISSSFRTSGFGAMQQLRLTIDSGELWQGAYELEISVRDRRTGGIAQRTGRFSILE
jgi:hypothetical protein